MSLDFVPIAFTKHIMERRTKMKIKVNENLVITTNMHYTPVLYWYDLTKKEQKEHAGSYDTIEESSFFRYRGYCYDMSDFMVTGKNSPFPSFWQGYTNDSFFSGVLVHISDDGEGVIPATFY